MRSRRLWVVAKAGHQRQHGTHGKLGLVHRGGPHDRPQYVNSALVYQRDDTRQIIGYEPIRLHDLQQRISRRMGVAATGVVFERSFGRGPAGSQPVSQASGVSVARHAGGHALRAFKNLFCAGEAVFGQVSRHQSRRCGMRGVQLFAV